MATGGGMGRRRGVLALTRQSAAIYTSGHPARYSGIPYFC